MSQVQLKLMLTLESSENTLEAEYRVIPTLKKL